MGLKLKMAPIQVVPIFVIYLANCHNFKECLSFFFQRGTRVRENALEKCLRYYTPPDALRL